mmetsp:Transcript_82283/g.145847  ORF Transcript_82283/g.145847 Transcript_82283/m.145847 type:complete len:104 (-) Transcript_82283:655-966(-)
MRNSHIASKNVMEKTRKDPTGMIINAARCIAPLPRRSLQDQMARKMTDMLISGAPCIAYAAPQEMPRTSCGVQNSASPSSGMGDEAEVCGMQFPSPRALSACL